MNPNCDLSLRGKALNRFYISDGFVYPDNGFILDREKRGGSNCEVMFGISEQVLHSIVPRRRFFRKLISQRR